MTLYKFIKTHVTQIKDIKRICIQDVYLNKVDERFYTLEDVIEWAEKHSEIEIDIPGSITINGDFIFFWVHENTEVPW